MVFSDFQTLGLAALLFASTNVDDIFLLAAFFADRHLRTGNVILGQFLGIGALVAASTVAALAAIRVPGAWIALLGIIPLLIGIRKLWNLRIDHQSPGTDTGVIRATEHKIEHHTHSQVLAVAAVTIANGGDNLGAYIPVFATDHGSIPAYVFVFGIMTAVWCGAGYAFVNHRVAGAHLRRWGHILLPFVLIGIGAFILRNALALFR